MHHQDVIIAGTGLYGTCLGAILARHGVRVQLIERARHPRFALGEALLPQSAIWPFILSNRFGVPELGALSHADRIVEEVTKTCGLKHSIGFAWHEAGMDVQPQDVQQLVPPHLPFYSESHLYRQDVDTFMLEAAVRHGCAYVDETKILEVSSNEDGVVVTTSAGTFSGAVYVDATGQNSVLAETLGLRRGAPELRTHSRSIFSHVEGLGPIDQWLRADAAERKLHHGTFHHVFEGGWMWIIPFDNFHRSTSSLASIGLMLDPRVHPEDASLSPEEEFHAIVARYPTLAAHMTGIVPQREFVRTGRVQFSATQAAGDRWILAPAAFGFVDALYSNGLVHTFESVFRVAHELLDSLGVSPDPKHSGDFSAAAFAGIDALHRAQLADADRMVSSAYAAMADRHTWSAWTQIWLCQVLFSDLWLQRACFKFFAAGDPSALDVLRDGTRPGAASPLAAGREALLNDVAALLSAGAEPTATAAGMLARLRAEAWLPRHVFDWGNAAARSVDFSRPEVVGALLGWGFGESPEPIRSGLFDFTLPPSPPADQ